MMPIFFRTQKMMQGSSDSWISTCLPLGYISLKHCSAAMSLNFSCAYMTDMRAYAQDTRIAITSPKIMRQNLLVSV